MHEVRGKKPDEEKSKKETKFKHSLYYIFSISYMIITFLLQLYYYIKIYYLRHYLEYAYSWQDWQSHHNYYQIINELKLEIPKFKMLTIIIITSLIIGLLFNNFYKSNNNKQKKSHKKINIYYIVSIGVIFLILLFSNPLNYIDKQIEPWSNNIN